MFTSAAVATCPIVNAMSSPPASVLWVNLVPWESVKGGARPLPHYLGPVGFGLACERGAPTAAPPADEFSASVAAPAHAAKIGWEIFGSASDTARDGLEITVTGSGTFIAPAGGRGTSRGAGRHGRDDAV